MLVECLKLPSVLNINPRSVYNKINNLKTYITENEIDLVCISESWERPEETLDKIINIENYVVISNVHQRKNHGGRPAIVVNEERFNVENITNSLIDIPWGVEAVWCIITPKNSGNNSLIKKIVVGSIYCKPNSRKKTVLLDHIALTYHTISSKYGSNVYWIICGDMNDLKLDSILHLNSSFRQVVVTPTRLQPPAILDPIITDLHIYYQTPTCENPIEVDEDKDGANSDHLIVKMLPKDTINNHVDTVKKTIIYRPLTDEGYRLMTAELEEFNWDFLAKEENVEVQLELFQETFYNLFDQCFPRKSKIITNKDEPFYNEKLKKLRKKKLREYNKHRKSEKYLSLNKLYKMELEKAKYAFYRNKIQKLKSSNSRQWYRQIKNLVKYDQKQENIEVDTIKHLTDSEQAETIAEKFAQVSNEYEPLNRKEIEIPTFSSEDIPNISESDIMEALENLKTNKSERQNDIPAKIYKHFSKFICKPLSYLIRRAIVVGCWPKFLKIESVTAIPKVPQPKNIDDLRNISGLMNLNKVFEKVICKFIIEDMKTNLDPAQFANQKGLSTQHYLVLMLDRILQALDNNSKGECIAVLATMIDWKAAFPRQCPTLGIQSFIRNGVRPSLIPILMSFFEDRKMYVKWHGITSEIRKLSGGGPQGSTLGILEYLSQSNDNADNVPVQDRFKFVDDLTVLEIIHLLNIGLASVNIRRTVPSNISSDNQIIPADNLKTQNYVNEIVTWTEKNRMLLNAKKTKNMIFNFTKAHQFTTDIKMKDEILETVSDTKLLGVHITSDLKWNKNTEEIIKKANKRMFLLHNVSKFTSKISDLTTVYKIFIRSILENSCVVWHSSLSEQNSSDIERVQKSACKVILKTYLTLNR